MHIVLHQPEIPANTGNIGRTCVATNTSLHLIEPLGFILSDKLLKRAGMDYWDKVKLFQYVDYEDFLEKNADAFAAGARLWYATTKAHQVYTEVSYGPDDFIMLGNESRGIPEEILAAHASDCVRIPMWGDIRSLNLANSAAVILYEALRQNDFYGLQRQGELHRLHWI